MPGGSPAAGVRAALRLTRSESGKPAFFSQSHGTGARAVTTAAPEAHTESNVAAHAGRGARVNLGGEPERDDFGLPPVDIEIPDDARELDRDVQAYHRELRAHRRRMRARRLHGPLTRDGMVLPLLGGCLVLALIPGTLLPLFPAARGGMPRLAGRTAVRPATTGK